LSFRPTPRLVALVAIASVCAGAIAGAAFVALKPFPYRWLVSQWSDLRGEPDRWRAERDARLAMLRALPTRAAVVMLGDSLTAAGEWRELLDGADVVNRGIDGDRTDDALARLDTVTASNPRAVFVMLGTNDLASGRPLDAVLADYRRIVGSLHAAGIAVVIQSTLECSRRVCGARLEAIRALNEGLRELAGRSGSAWIDLNATLATPSQGLRAEHTWDGVHLTASGYAAWAGLVAQRLRQP
jgi:lysophospholipase L1-like esterase